VNKVSLASFTKTEHQTLLKCGVPKNIFSFKPYLLDNALTSFTSEVDGLKPKRISANTQGEYLDKIFANPYHSHYVLCIAGKPNDNLAKQLAAVILNRAIQQYIAASRREMSARSKLLRQRTYPIWHNVTGSFQDDLRDKRHEHRPAMLVLANITRESSGVKKEKVRDLIELYSACPIIVVLAGTDPMTFFNEHLLHSLNYAVLVCKPGVIKEIQL